MSSSEAREDANITNDLQTLVALTKEAQRKSYRVPDETRRLLSQVMYNAKVVLELLDKRDQRKPKTIVPVITAELPITGRRARDV